jgi:hypothetical protein
MRCLFSLALNRAIDGIFSSNYLGLTTRDVDTRINDMPHSVLSLHYPSITNSKIQLKTNRRPKPDQQQ